MIHLLSFVAMLGAADFRHDVTPFLTKHCAGCHNSKAKVANLDLLKYKSSAAVMADQDVWDRIARKIRTREMPPKGVPAPSQAEIDGVLGWLNAEYARFDKSAKPDPGRVTAR